MTLHPVLGRAERRSELLEGAQRKRYNKYY